MSAPAPEVTPIELVIVPLDGSGFAEQAIPFAVEMGRQRGARVQLVSVYETPLAPHGGVELRPYDPAFDQRNREALSTYLTEVAGRVSASGVDAQAVILEGSPAAVIAEHATDAGADVIVMTSHGRRGPERMWLGSVTTDLLHRVATAVLVVRTAPAGDTAASVAFRRVLVGVDGSEASERAIAEARRIAGSAEVEYVLARAVQTMTDHSERKQEADEYLDRLARPLRTDGLVVSIATPAHENPAAGLVTLAKNVGADLLAIGAHSRSRLERLFLGSVADKVVRTAPMAVLVARGPRDAAHGRAVAVPPARAPALGHIAVGVDFSPPSEAAVRWVCARFARSEISLLHTVRVPPVPSFVGGDVVQREQKLEDLRHSAERRLEEFSDSLGTLSAQRSVEVGRPSERLIGIAERIGADVLVVGAHGQRKGLARVIGSTAERVLRTSSIPVLLARGLSPEPPRRVLVGVEESDITPAVVEWARVVCTHFGASVMLLHVADPELVDAISIAGSRAEVRRARDDLRRAAMEWLSQQAEVLRAAGLDVTADVTFGDPASKLLVRSLPPRNDLVIIGRRGTGSVQRAIIGSVADRVLRLGKGPVLVIPESHAG